MKKSVFLFIFSLFSLVFAEVKLTAIQDESLTVNNNSYSSSSTFVTKDNVEITMITTKVTNDDNIKIGLQIKNNGDETFNFNENMIRAYQGIFEENNWSEINYHSATKYYSTKKYEHDAAIAVAAVGCGLLVFDLILATACDDSGSSSAKPAATKPNTPKATAPKQGSTPRTRAKNGPSSSGRTPKRNPPAPAPRHDSNVHASIHVTYEAGSLLSAMNEASDDLEFLRNNLLYSRSVAPGQSVSGIFYISKQIGPDYKVVLELEKDECAEFYFTRSDKESILHPWRDNGEDHHVFALGIGAPTWRRLSLTYLYCANPVGVYCGVNYQFPNTGSVVGKIDHNHYYPEYESDYWVSEVEPGTGHYESYKDYFFDPDGKSTDEFFGFYGGLTIKTIPHTWLLIGMGLDVGHDYYRGTEFGVKNNNDEIAIRNKVWVEENKLRAYATPQVGVNAIFNVFDIGATFGYRIGYGPQFDILMGVAF